jgi:hypothetical protein
MNLREIYSKQRCGQGQQGQQQLIDDLLPPELSAPYLLEEILAIYQLPPEDIRLIHEAKIRLGGQRVGGQ